MKKLRLDLESLVVDSFETGEEKELKGTVRGLATTLCNTVDRTCDGAATCDGPTCNRADYSCALSCTACNTQRCGGDGDTLLCGGAVSGISTCPGCLNC